MGFRSKFDLAVVLLLLAVAVVSLGPSVGLGDHAGGFGLYVGVTAAALAASGLLRRRAQRRSRGS